MPQQEWASTTPDTRTFGQQIGRLIDDLNRPDLQGIAQSYLQDAARYFQRKPFFFSDIDNSRVFGWGQTSLNGPVQGSLHYTHGATIVMQATDGNLYGFVNLIGGTSGATIPTNFGSTLYSPSGLTLAAAVRPYPRRHDHRWEQPLRANAGPWPGQGVQFTQLCPPPFQNQYPLPLGLRLAQAGGSYLVQQPSIGMTKISLSELRDLDVVRPAPRLPIRPTGRFQQQIYFWPYPVGFYPITLSYNTGLPIPIQMNDSNLWTTQAEALIRYYAAFRICKVVLQDDVGAAQYQMLAAEELAALVSQGIAQQQSDLGGGIVADLWQCRKQPHTHRALDKRSRSAPSF